MQIPSNVSMLHVAGVGQQLDPCIEAMTLSHQGAQQTTVLSQAGDICPRWPSCPGANLLAPTLGCLPANFGPTFGLGMGKASPTLKSAVFLSTNTGWFIQWSRPYGLGQSVQKRSPVNVVKR